jgi:hypothetical protein
MLVLGELALNFGTNAESWGIRTETFRKRPLQLLKLSKQLVVLGVRDRWTVENVVLVGRAGEQIAQLRGALKPGLADLRPGSLALR